MVIDRIKALYKCRNCHGFFNNPRQLSENEKGCEYCGHDDIRHNEENTSKMTPTQSL